MKTQVILSMKEQHRLKMAIDYESGKVKAQRAAALLDYRGPILRRQSQLHNQPER